MKLSYDKPFEHQISISNGKYKIIKSTTKLPNLSKQNTIISNTNYCSALDENKNLIDLENINLEKLTNQLNKYKQELVKYKETRDEARINLEFSKIKAKQREKEIRLKILLTSQKLNSKDFEILKSQIHSISNKIVGNISLLDKEAKKEIKNNKIDMNSRLSLKLLEVENKHNQLFNIKYLFKEHQLNEFNKQMLDLQKTSEDYGKLAKKKNEFESLNFTLNEKIRLKEDENLILKRKVCELIRMVNVNAEKALEEMLATNKKNVLNNFEKLKKIIDNKINSDGKSIYNHENNYSEIKRESKNLTVVSKSYNTSFFNKSSKVDSLKINKNPSNNKKNNTLNNLDNVNLIYNLSKSQSNYKKLTVKVDNRISSNKVINKNNDKLFNDNEKIEINFTSKRQSQITNLPVLKEESLIEKKSFMNKKDEKSSDYCFFNNKLNNEDSKESKYINEFNKDLDLFKSANNVDNLNNDNNQIKVNRNLNQINQKELDSINNRTSNFYSEKNEISFFNVKSSKANLNQNNKKSIETFEFDNYKEKELLRNIDNNIDLYKINILLEKATEFLEKKSFVSQNPRLASVMASFANMLNNIKEKIFNMKKKIEKFHITSKKINNEILAITQHFKRSKIKKDLTENHCLKKTDLVMHKIKDGLTFKNEDSKKFMDAILSNEFILNEYETSTFKHIIKKHNIFK